MHHLFSISLFLVVGEPQDASRAFSGQPRLYQLPEGGLTLAAHDVVDELRIRAFADLLCSQGGMIASENRLCACLFGDGCQSQGFLVLKAHGGQAHQIVAVNDPLHILPVIFQAVNVRHMHRAQIVHMRRQGGQAEIGQAGDAVKVELNHGRREQQYLHLLLPSS